MMHLLRTKASPEQIADMLKEYESMIKIVVDIRRRVFDSLINIRPALRNRSILIQSEELREQVASVAFEILGGVR